MTVEAGHLRDEEGGVEAVVLRDGDSGDTLEVQRPLAPDDQDRALGQDTYCVVRDGATQYGGVVAWDLRDGVLVLELTPEAADALELPVETHVSLDEEAASVVRAHLPGVLGVSRHHPDPVGTGSAGRDDVACLLCGRTDTPSYRAEVVTTSGDVDDDLCTRCVVDGRAHAELGATFTDALLAVDGWTDVPEHVAREVRERTPAPFTWQAARWLACCGDAAVYLGVAAEAPPPGLTDEQVRATVGPAGDDAPSWYVFRCRRCLRLLTYDDEP